MAVRQDRGRWVVEFAQAGVRVFKRLPAGVTKLQAQDWETKRRREIFDGTLGKREELTLEAAIGLWLEQNGRKNQRQAASEAKQWAPFVAGKLAREAPEVAQEAIASWRTLEPKRPSHSRPRTGPFKPSSATMNRRLALLKAVLKHAWRQGLIEQNLSGRIPLLREDNKREVYLTRAQVNKLASCAPSDQSRAAIMIAAGTGLRASELLAITAPISSRAATLLVEKSKTGKARLVPVSPFVRPHLSALPLGLSYWQLHSDFSAARKKAKMPHVQFHDLRHTCASWLINAGVDLYTVGKILGHSGPATTARYAHLSTATLQDAMRRLK